MAVNFNEQALLTAVRTAAMQGVVRGTESVRNEAISLVLDTQKTGRVYRRRGVEHQASAPGEPWASDHGGAGALGRIVTSYDESRLAGKVNFGAEYAPYLEYGTQRMAPRPVARPALANKRAEIERVIAAEGAKGLR